MVWGKLGTRIASLLLILMTGSWAQQSGPPPAQGAAGGVSPSEPLYRVLRAVSGSKGQAQGSQFIVEDPRTIFYIPEDKQVIVYFEWEGRLGQHSFEGLWKNPEGKVTVISEFSYAPTTPRFGGYWTLVLADTTPTGVWTLEARIDGEAAGSYPFQILATPRPPGEETPRVRVPLRPAEIYKRAVAAAVSIEALDESGENIGEGTGFLAGEGIVVTAFQVIDGAHALRLRYADSSTATADVVLAFNRWQDWAILKVPTTAAPKLARAERPAEVGQRVYTLDTPSPGSRTIVDMDVTGLNTFERAGERLNVTNTVSVVSTGAPLLNEYGELVGVMGGNLLPGSGSLNFTRYNYMNLNLTSRIRGGLAVPMSLVKLAGGHGGRLQDLHAAGVMVPALRRRQEIVSGTLSRVTKTRAGTPMSMETRNEFTRADKECAVLLLVRGTEKVTTQVVMRVFDMDNHMLADGKPKKVGFRTGESRSLEWKLPLASLQPGFYRVDVLFDGLPVWRSFLEMTD